MAQSCSPAVLALVLTLRAGACLAAPTPAWMEELEPLLAQQPGSGGSVVEVLERLPLADRQTADYHAMLARALHAADRPGPAAEAVATCALLDPRRERDLGAVRRWLAARAQVLAQAARNANVRQDTRASTRALLEAGKCDPCVLAEDLSGTESALAGLDRAARRHPERPVLRFQSGFISYLHGQVDKAAADLRLYASVERDPYRSWRARVWLARVEWEIAQARPARAGGAISMDGLERAAPARPSPGRQIPSR